MFEPTKTVAVVIPLHITTPTAPADYAAVESAALAVPNVERASVSVLPPSAGSANMSSTVLLTIMRSSGVCETLRQLEPICGPVAENQTFSGERAVGFCSLAISGMSCGSCVARIEQGLRSISGVLGRKVTLADSQGLVWFDPAVTSSDALSTAVQRLGYQSLLQGQCITLQASFTVSGMSCGSCAAHIEASLLKQEGVKSASVSFTASLATVWVDPSLTTSSAIESSIAALGYKVCPKASAAAPPPIEDKYAPRGPAANHTTKVLVQQPAKVQRETFTVSGMSCGACAAHIESSLLKRPGMVSASVNFAMLSANVTFDLQTTTAQDVMKLIQDLGYKATPQRCFSLSAAGGTDDSGDLTMLVEGMSCAACAAKIEREVSKLAGVASCNVNFATTTASVKIDPAIMTESTVLHLVESLGYQARIMPRLSSAAADETKKALERTREISLHWQRFIKAFCATLLMMAIMLLHLYVPLFHHKHGNFVAIFSMYVAEFCLATPVVLSFGWHFFEKAYIDMKHRTFTMDTLIAFGVGGAYVFSTITLGVIAATGDVLNVNFDAATMLLTFMLLGKYLEAHAKRSTSSALIQLMSLVPPTAVVVLPSGDVTIPSAAIRKGQRLRVLAGERIPTDGMITDGTSDVDEQLVTGESVPRAVTIGDKVVGGTLNCQSVLVVEATRVGEETMLAQVLRTVQEAQNSKPAVQRIADKIAGVFVPIVVAYALLALLVWLFLGYFDLYPADWRNGETVIEYSFQFFLATVVSACPCALGLATPTAIMVGTGVGARNGILIKSGTTLETCRKVTSVVLDKTGTITTGKQTVVLWSNEAQADALLASALSPEAALAAVISVTKLSSHPISKSIAAYAQQKQQREAEPAVSVTNCVTVPGNGMWATVQIPTTADTRESSRTASTSWTIRIGSPSFLQSEGASMSPQTLAAIRHQQAEGHTTVVCAVDATVLYVIALSDRPKGEAAGVVNALHAADIAVYMVTGDSQGVAEAVAWQVGIPTDRIHAHVLPDGKASFVRDLQARGEIVMFVGDGINDSPALATADVGVALGAGTDVAIEAADAVLIHSSLVDILTFVKLSQKTVQRIYGNFVWACGYNIVMLPVAAGLLVPILRFQLPPMVAGAAMVCSSLSVLGSSLLLRCFAPCTASDLPLSFKPVHSARRSINSDGVSLLCVNQGE